MRRTLEKIKERKAITLIALVVTIVVILILAGITVGMVTSDNGILKETKNAKQQAEIDNEKSIVERAKMPIALYLCRSMTRIMAMSCLPV